MKIKLTLVSVLATGALLMAGCGGDDSSSVSAEDEEAITELVAEINRVTEEQDAQGFCAVMSPSDVTEQFDTQSRCVKETTQILKLTGGEDAQLEVENIEVDGDTASVDLKGAGGGAPVQLVKEGGKWYVPLANTSEVEGSDSETTDE